MFTSIFDERPEQLLGLGIVAIVASMFLPWVTAPLPVILVDGSLQSSVTGIETPDGQLVLVATIVLVGVAALDAFRTAYWGWLKVVSIGLAGLLATLAALMYINDPETGAEISPGTPALDAGAGLYVVFLGGVLLLGAAVSGFQRRRTTTGEPGAEADVTAEDAQAGEMIDAETGEGIDVET